MPIAKDIIKKITLPGYPEEDPAILEVVVNPKASVMDGANTDDKNSLEYHILSRTIVSWNFTDEKGEVLPITPETIKSTLSIFDIDVIHGAMGLNKSLTKEEKKS